MIGWAQALQSVVDNMNGYIDSVAGSLPNLDSTLKAYVENQFQLAINPNQGTYWAVGVLFILIGFVLIATDGRKDKSSKQAATETGQ